MTGAQGNALDARCNAGEAMDPHEHVSGTVPGYRRLQQNGRLLRRAAQHGVWPPNRQDLELASNIGIVQAGPPDKTTTTVAGITDEDETERLARHQRELNELALIDIARARRGCSAPPCTGTSSTSSNTPPRTTTELIPVRRWRGRAAIWADSFGD